MTEALASPLPDMKISVRQVFGIDTDLEVPAYSEADEHVPDLDADYLFDRETTLAILAGFARNRRVLVTGYHGTGKSTHIEQVAARLNWPMRARQPRQPHQPYRPRRQGRDRAPRRHAGDRVPRRHAAVGAPAQHRALLRRIRRRPAGRDVRHPARARSFRPPDAPRPEQGHPPAPGLPPVRHGQHRRPRRYVRPLSRHPADQPGPDGPLVDRHHAELSAARQRGEHRRRQGAEVARREGPRHHRQDGARRRHDAERLHQRRPVDGDEPAHGHHLGRERRDLRRHRLRLPRHLRQQVRRTGAEPRSPSSTSARSIRNCPSRRRTW